MSSTRVDIDPPELAYVLTPDGPIYINRASIASLGPAYGPPHERVRRLYTWGSVHVIKDTPENLKTLGVHG